MTNKEFFIKTIEGEQPAFENVLKAFKGLDLSYTPGEKARTAGKILFQLSCQSVFISGIAKNGAPDWSTYKDPEQYDLDVMLETMQKNFAQLKTDLAELTDDVWENQIALMEWPGGKWEVKRFEMAWSFLHDGIHHRGQLTSYLRALGGKVPSIYGGSADEAPTGN